MSNRLGFSKDKTGIERRRVFWRALSPAVACAAMLLATPLFAVTPESAQSLKKLSLEDLGKVQVSTYSKTPSQLWSTPAAIYIISNEDILRSGVTSIADALELAPGVEVGRVSATTWAVGIRGLENNFSKSVLVLVDGRNVYTPLFAGVYWDVQDMPLDDIDHIEVIRGPGATNWGPNAANGVINIITKSATDTHGILADALVGTQDHTINDVQVGGESGGFDFRFFGRGVERRHEYHSDRKNIDTWHQERFGFRGDRTAGSNTYLIEGDVYRGSSPHIVGTTPFEDQTSGGDINVRWDHGLTTERGFYLQAYFDRTLRTHTAVGETRNTFNIDFTHHFEAGESNLVSYGGTLRWSPWTTIPAGTLVPRGGTDHEHVAFVQDEIRLAERVWLTAGAKLEHNNYSGWDFSPSARLIWSQNDKQAIWGAVTRAVTTPSDIEENFRLQGQTGKTVIQVLGDHAFKTESVVGYEVGYRRRLGRDFVMGASVFRNDYSWLQSFTAPAVTSAGGLTYITITYANQISGSVSGGELSTQAQITPWWRFIMNYSFQNSDFSAHGATSDISSTGSVRTYEGSSPKHMVKVQSRFDLPARIQFDQTYRFISELRAQQVPAYQTMDVHLEKALGQNFALELVGQNLFQNRHYEWGTGDPAQPPVGIYRAGYVRLVFHSKGNTK